MGEGAKTPLYAPEQPAACAAGRVAEPSATLVNVTPKWPVSEMPLVGPASELQLTIDGGAVPHDEVLAELDGLTRAGARETTTVKVGRGSSK